MHRTIKTDFAVIGAGSAGLSAFDYLSGHKHEVILIEGEQYGTTCARVGCMPSKLLIAAAEAAEGVRDSRTFGIDSGKAPYIDGVKVMERVRNERDYFVSSVLDQVEEIDESRRFNSYASFVEPGVLRLESGEEIRARVIIIATGSAPNIPEMLADAGERIVTSDDIFYWRELPESLVVFGPGVIGMEIGQALHRLGVRTAIIGRGRALKYLHDPEVRLAAADIFAEKLCFAPDAKTTKTKLINERLQVDFTDYSGKRLSESFEYALAAAGRIPNLEKLSLENSDLELDENGIPAYDPATMQCGDSNVFIAGDATGKRPFLHEAIHEGRIAARNAVRYPTVEREARHTPLSIVFTSPQAGYAGKRYDELDLDNAAVAKLSFKEQARSRIIGKGRGLMHIYADKSNGRIIGTEMIGPAAEHLVHLLAWAIEKQFTVDDLRNLPFYHPVIEEGIFYSLEELQ